ncbi:hypothetical protein D3C74_421770 [compost metagenome]
MDTRAIGIELSPIARCGGWVIIREALIFGDQINNVHPETADPFVRPKNHQVSDFLSNPLIFPV